MPQGPWVLHLKLEPELSVDQHRRALQVVGLSRQQREVDQVTERVGQRHDPGGYAAARTANGLILSPPFAP